MLTSRPRVATGDRAERPPFISGPLPAPPPEDVALADLAAFFRDPVKGFFRALDYTLPWEVDGVEDAMPVDINALEEWTVGDRMLRRHAARHAPRPGAGKPSGGAAPCRPGKLGWRKATEIRDQAAAAGRGRPAIPPPRTGRASTSTSTSGSGRRLTGTVSPVFGDRLVAVTYSKLDGRHLLQSWIPLLALLAHDPNRDWSAVCIGRPKRGTAPRQEELGRPAEAAVDLLADLVAIYDAGRREPIPLPLKTSYAWAEAEHSHGDPERSAGFRWRSNDRYPGEDAEKAHERACGKGAWLSALDRSPALRLRTPRRLWLPMLRALDGA